MESKFMLIALSILLTIFFSPFASASLATCRTPMYEGICCSQYTQDIMWPSGNGMCCGGMPYLGAKYCPWAEADCAAVTCNPKCDGNYWNFLGWCTIGGQCLYWAQNCDNLDGCYNTTGAINGTNSYVYRDYYCQNGPMGCQYNPDDCRDCSCKCDGYGVEESVFNYNCFDGKDNDCDGFCDTKGCTNYKGEVLQPDPKCGLTISSLDDLLKFCPYDASTHTYYCGYKWVGAMVPQSSPGWKMWQATGCAGTCDPAATCQPPVGWASTTFDDSSWLSISTPNDGWGCDRCTRAYRYKFNLDAIPQGAKLYVRSDDGARCYLNGNLINTDSGCHGATYWNYEWNVSSSYFVLGTNVLACQVAESWGGEGFDARLNNTPVTLVPAPWNNIYIDKSITLDYYDGKSSKNIVFNVKDKFVINGNLNAVGAGCVGGSGGSITIYANNVTVTGNLNVYGGDGNACDNSCGFRNYGFRAGGAGSISIFANSVKATGLNANGATTYGCDSGWAGTGAGSITVVGNEIEIKNIDANGGNGNSGPSGGGGGGRITIVGSKVNITGYISGRGGSGTSWGGSAGLLNITSTGNIYLNDAVSLSGGSGGSGTCGYSAYSGWGGRGGDILLNGNNITIKKDVNIQTACGGCGCGGDGNALIKASSVSLQSIPTSTKTEINASGLINATSISGTTIRLKTGASMDVPTLSGRDIRVDSLGNLNISKSITSSSGSIYLRGWNVLLNSPVKSPGGNITIVGNVVNVNETISAAGNRGGWRGDGQHGGSIQIYADYLINLTTPLKITAEGGDSFGIKCPGGCPSCDLDEYCGNGGNGGDVKIFADNHNISSQDVSVDRGWGNCWENTGCKGSDDNCFCGTTICHGAGNSETRATHCHGVWGSYGTYSIRPRSVDPLIGTEAIIKEIASLLPLQGSFQVKIRDRYTYRYVTDKTGEVLAINGSVVEGKIVEVLGVDRPFTISLGKPYILELAISNDLVFNDGRCKSGAANCDKKFIDFETYVA